MEIICKEHGSFWQLPQGHVRGHKSGCQKCAVDQLRLNVDEFIAKSKVMLKEASKEVHADTFTPVLKLGNSIPRFLSESDLVQTPEGINPIFIAAMNKKVTQLGEGGLSADAARNEFGARNLTITGVNKVDPIETPESGNIGFVQHLAQAATIKNKTIYII